MQIVNSPQEMQKLSLKWRELGQRIAFVPTMGALHEGHLSLLREARRIGDKLVISIFVNPTQFSPNEDLSKYPRDKDGDLVSARDCKVDAVYFPTEEDMYPKGHQTFVEVAKMTKGLCGARRPTHFRGVTTVVLKLFNIVQPHVALFGEKDFQQLAVVRTMVRDLNLPIEIIGMPIVRDSDGLALSSRNAYLSPTERISVPCISKSLKIAQKMVISGEKDAKKVINIVKTTIESEKSVKIDYIEICDSNTLESQSVINGEARLLIAAHIGKTRLIDNCRL